MSEKIKEGFMEEGRGINDANSVSGTRMMDPQKSTDSSLSGYNAVGHQQHMVNMGSLAGHFLSPRRW